MERGSRWAMLNDFADHHAHGLGVAAVAVWLLLFRHADRDGRVSVSQSRITRALGCHVRTVRRALTKLRRLGLVTVVTPGSRATGPAVLVLALPIGDKKCPHIGDKKYPNDRGQKVPRWGTKSTPMGDKKYPLLGTKSAPLTELQKGNTADAARAAAVSPITGKDSRESHRPDDEEYPDDVPDPRDLFYDDDEARRRSPSVAGEPGAPDESDGLPF